MTVSPRRAAVLFAILLSSVACDDAVKARDTEVAVAPVAPLPPVQQEIVSQKAEVTLPGAWAFGYRLVDKHDTTYGSFRAIEFHYVGDSAAKVPPRMLLVIRAFKKAAWEKIATSQQTVATKLAEHGDDVYAYSIVTTNPYPLGSASALRVDAMMLALIADGSPFKITFQ